MPDFLKFKVDDFILEEYSQHAKLIEPLKTHFQSLKEINAAIKHVKAQKKSQGIEDVDSLLDEIEEIKEDLTWAGSKRGQFVSYVADNHAAWEAQVLQSHAISGLMLRGHSEQYAVCAMGKIKHESERQPALSTIEKTTGQKTLDFLTLDT